MRVGGRRGVRAERGKHGEGFGFVEGRNKGESVSEFVSGVRRFNNGGGRSEHIAYLKRRDHYMTETCTVFVDNLPTEVTKRDLFKEFGKDGYIADIYISRKERQRANRLFAFIRFNSQGGAMKSIERMNGRRWRESQLYVILSKYDKQPMNERNKPRAMIQNHKKKRMVRKWIAVKDNRPNDKMVINEPQKNTQTKTIDGVWAEDQREMLQRSLLGCFVKPNEFRKVMNLLLYEWSSEGDIECRDIGPYRCLITFSSSDIRDKAFSDPLLLSVFDEIRPHRGIFWNLSRRVWIEIMGLPVCMWCEENINRVAELWGKVVEHDDRSGDWSKAYSVQVHPDLVKECSALMEESTSTSRVEETPMGVKRLPTVSGRQNSNRFDDDDPQLGAIINANYSKAQPSINGTSDGEGVEEACWGVMHPVN
ncbi:hypothetical protein PIB30_001595 [Stylosanthes scabra]|uniref:RRM domain-containing protein n=1 Tax=Stylosanthes scabra TaxID=79078 RepID=A0ABU6S2M7_9FABA|nr:hypothetical protein [Stylosanthes scabra]